MAACWVTLYHLRETFIALFGTVPLKGIADIGYLGVDLFFVLSGFILVWNYQSKLVDGVSLRSFATFIGLRLARIYPVHFAVMVVLACAVTVAHGAGVQLGANAWSVRDFVLNILLIHAWNTTDALSWNTPSWSISAEWFAYLLFPFMPRLLARAPGLTAPLALVLAPIALGWFVYEHLGQSTIDLTFDGALVRVAVAFVLGVALGRARISATYGRVAADAACVVSVAGLMGVAYGNAPDVLALPCFGILVYALSLEGGMLARLLGHRALVYGGLISYSWYMIHALVLMAEDRFAVALGVRAWSPAMRSAFVAQEVAVMALLAGLLYRFVEEPARRYLQARLSARVAR